MASIFSSAMNFLKSAFNAAATTDFLRDYKHARELFVGNNFSLVPKSGYLFHVFFDLNPQLANSILLDNVRSTQLGMMVKEVDLPRFGIETKIFNAYNRPNIVQSKIKYEPVSITFRDDSVNLVRNFWRDYYNFYYRDTNNSQIDYKQSHKYEKDVRTNFGFSLRRDNPHYNYLEAVRIYSLTHNQFTEYVLINPTITSFRHGKHDYESQESANMTHEMALSYEGVAYNEGYVADGAVKGFANLIYDRARSPLNRVGSRRSIFGAGGLVNTASSIFSDLTSGTATGVISGIFKAATARQTFKGVNIKKAAVSELKQIYTQEATNAITGVINQQFKGNPQGGRIIPSSSNLPASVGFDPGGITSTGSTLALVGVASILNNRELSNRYKRDPVQQRNAVSVSNYNPQFPKIPGANSATAPRDVLKANDSNLIQLSTNQTLSNTPQRKLEIAENMRVLETQIQSRSASAAFIQGQINTLNNNIGNLNNRLNLAKSSGASAQTIASLEQEIISAQNQKQDNESRLTALRTDMLGLQARLNASIVERNALANV